MNTHTSSTVSRVGCFLYGAIAYVIFLGTFSYAAGFIEGVVVPKHVDSGTPGPILESIFINALLLSLFVIQHTVMARPQFKKAWTRIIPAAVERSTFVLVTCGILILMFWQWRPMPEVVWHVSGSALRTSLYALSGLGWVLVLYSSFCIDHFDLFGLRQVVMHLRAKTYTHPGFAMPWLYKLVRNPLMLGFLTAFWATPTMTQGHLLFCLLVTGYVFMGVWFEERDLLAILGDDYREYRARTPMLLPFPRPKASVSAGPVVQPVEVGNAS